MPSGSISSASAAPHASAIPGRCRRRFPRHDQQEDLVACAVLSGNRNFEGRVNADVRANYLASPPLVVAYALAGTLQIDLTREPLGTGKDGKPVYLKDIWPSNRDISEMMRKTLQQGDVHAQIRRPVQGRRALAQDQGRRRHDLQVGSPLDLCAESAVLRRA